MTETQKHVIEDKNMQIRHLEREIKKLTKQNYQLMKRISELVDLLRANNISLG